MTTSKSGGREIEIKYTSTTSDEVQLRRRKYFLEYNHGVDWDTYIRMYESQDGNCACCGDTLDMYAKSTVLDHDHETGLARSILCSRCNAAAGMVQESSERAMKLFEYLRKFGR